jgi:hypothetical protein
MFCPTLCPTLSCYISSLLGCSATIFSIIAFIKKENTFKTFLLFFKTPYVLRVVFLYI